MNSGKTDRYFMENKYFTINEVAAALGISKQTLIRYEKKNIFPKYRRNPLNKWREYTLKDISELKKIMGRLE
jgi:DNA-binding transcriptional MerR regulator